MMAMMVMRALHGLHLLLQRRQRLLRFADVAGLQGIADLAQRLGKRTATLIGLRLRERRIGALRSREVAGLYRAGQLSERLSHRIDWRQNTGRGGRDWSNCHDTSPAGPSCPAWNRVARAYGLSGGDLQTVNKKFDAARVYARRAEPVRKKVARCLDKCIAAVSAYHQISLRLLRNFLWKLMHVRSCGGSRAFGQATT
jgi:hypothetical protein